MDELITTVNQMAIEPVACELLGNLVATDRELSNRQAAIDESTPDRKTNAELKKYHNNREERIEKSIINNNNKPYKPDLKAYNAEHYKKKKSICWYNRNYKDRNNEISSTL